MQEFFSSVRLRQFPKPLKFTISLTLIVLGVGYIIALGNLYLTYHLTDGEAGLTPDDLKRAFYGDRSNTRLAAKIDGGSMEQFLPVPGEKEKILSWIQDGADEEGYGEVVAPILTKNCLRCHNPRGVSSFRPLTSYEEVLKVTEIDRGEPVQLWARVAHTHIQSIGLIFLVLGSIFSLTSLRESIRTAVILAPFLALLLDFGTRFLVKYSPGLVFP
ncbi:MAG: hypothetical protein ACE5H0_08855, partial [Bacteroidota bacterium]